MTQQRLPNDRAVQSVTDRQGWQGRQLAAFLAQPRPDLGDAVTSDGSRVPGEYHMTAAAGDAARGLPALSAVAGPARKGISFALPLAPFSERPAGAADVVLVTHAQCLTVAPAGPRSRRDDVSDDAAARGRPPSRR